MTASAKHHIEVVVVSIVGYQMNVTSNSLVVHLPQHGVGKDLTCQLRNLVVNGLFSLWKRKLSRNERVHCALQERHTEGPQGGVLRIVVEDVA